MLETLTDGVQVFDADGTMVSSNAAAARLYQLDDDSELSTAAILAKWEVLDESGAPIAVDQRPLAVTRRTGLASEGTVVGLRNVVDGGMRWLSVSTSPVREGTGEITGYVSCTRDLTDRVETVRGLRILTAAARRLTAYRVPGDVATALTEVASELCSAPGERPRRAILMLVRGETMVMSGLTDPTHTGAYANPEVPLADNPYAQRVLQTGETLVTGFTAADFGPSSADVIRDAGVRNAAMVPMLRDGSIFAILAVSGRQDCMMSEGTLSHLEALATLGALAYANAETHQLSSLASRTDPLTGVGNRRALEDRCAALPRCPFAVVAIDVDHLKTINDTHGHATGDLLLSRVATAMAGELRPSDILVRTGGDEFVALLVNCDSAGVAHAVRRLRCAVEGLQFSWGRASASYGCATGAAGELPSSVLTAADEDLYRAKATR